MNTNNNVPLGETTVLITRAENQSDEFRKRIEALGGGVVVIPMIRIADPESWEACDRALIHIKKYDGIIFTSSNGVRGFLKRLNERFPASASILNRRIVYAVGEKTAQELRVHGIVPQTAASSNADALLAFITRKNPAGKQFLFPGGNLRLGTIERGLSAADAVVDAVDVYRTEKPTAGDADLLVQVIKNGSVDIIVFFSPSAVHNFFEIIDPISMRGSGIAVIGTTTSDAIGGYGIAPDIVPPASTAEDLTEAIVRYVVEKKSRTVG